MAKINKSLVLVIAVLGLFSASAQNYKLVWEDNFDGSTLDSSKWNVEQKVGIWNTGANHEFQHYKKENVSVGDDGNGNNCLILTAKNESYNGYAYTSGKVTTKGKFAFRRGKFEASIKIPDLANGLWPAFWSLGYTPKGWPDNGEIDVMEMGHARGIADGVQNSYMGAHLFWGPYPRDYGTSYTSTEDLSTGFFKHTCVWDESKISVFFNDATTPYFSMGIGGADTEEFRDFQEYIILNLAVGGSLPGISYAGDITAPFPANMYVDWVKVYQEEGLEDFDTNLELYGEFGVYEDKASVDMRMDLGYDIFEQVTAMTTKIDETPYEGDNVLSYNVASGNLYELALASGLSRNMKNYNAGSLHFYIKTDIAGDIQMGITDATGAEKFVTFNADNEANFDRNGTWQSVYLILSDFADVVDLTSLKDMLIIKGTADAASFISIDKLVYKETVPVRGYYSILCDNSNINDGFKVDNVNTHMYVWQNVTFNDYYPAYEGETVLSFKSTTTGSWYGFGFISDNPLNFEAFANGYLNISIRTASTDEFTIGLDSEGGKKGEIKFLTGSELYGLRRDGEWHHLNIPMSDLTSQGLDLSTTKHVLFASGGSISNIAFDNVFYSEKLPTLENPMICKVGGITVTPGSKTIDIDQILTLKAEVLNQFGKKFDNRVVWSTDAGNITADGKFSAGEAGNYIISATQDGIVGNANITVEAPIGISESDGNSVNSYFDKNLNELLVNNINSTSYITVHGITGNLIFSAKTRNRDISISLAHEPNGIYIVRVISDNATHINKIVKK